MTIEQFRRHMADGLPVGNGSEAHLLMHQMAQEAIRITMEINNRYHTPEEIGSKCYQLLPEDLKTAMLQFMDYLQKK